MNQQKPRDNSMYMLSDCTNLNKQDKALKNSASKFGLFGHSILSHKQRKEKKAAFIRRV